MQRNKLYSLVLIASLSGIIWISWNLINESNSNLIYTSCIIKSATNIPCPSCGTTRSIITLIKGNIVESLSVNPLGILLSMLVILFPIWVLMDFIQKKSRFLYFFRDVEKFFQRREIAITSIILILLNWIWNIYKGL